MSLFLNKHFSWKFEVNKFIFKYLGNNLTRKSDLQCEGQYGVCPDERIGFRNDANIINGERRDGSTSITFSRPFETGDRHDLKIKHGPQTIVAAIGSLDVHKVAKYHTQFWTKGWFAQGFVVKTSQIFNEMVDRIRYLPFHWNYFFLEPVFFFK